MLYQFSQPKILESYLRYVTPIAYILTSILFIIGLVYALHLSPPDYQQGDSVRIMYIHVPASWLALMIYGFMGLCSICFFIFRIPIAALMAYSAAPIGAVYTLISLMTGSIWGKPMWGTWWVWDARLTSMFILFIMYLGYILLVDSNEDRERGFKMGSYLTIIGLINLPIIKFSVTWWHTLHQGPSVLKLSGPSIHSSMLIPLLLMASAYFFLFTALLSQRLQTQLLMQKLQRLQLKLYDQR